MFIQYNLDFDTNLFDELSTCIKYEDITKGRLGANLVNDNTIIPLVRTTTKYKNPVQLFSPIHYDIINKIQMITEINNINFNNAMIEIYDNNYTNMKYHTDQSLDLEPESYICLFSCYSNPNSKSIRKLRIKDKESNIESEFMLNHNSIIIFSLETNKKFNHKILLNHHSKSDNNKWLGITFRMSKTYIHFKNEIPYFYQTGIILRQAEREEEKEFYRLKKEENNKINFNYDFIDYTIDSSNLIKIN